MVLRAARAPDETSADNTQRPPSPRNPFWRIGYRFWALRTDLRLVSRCRLGERQAIGMRTSGVGNELAAAARARVRQREPGRVSAFRGVRTRRRCRPLSIRRCRQSQALAVELGRTPPSSPTNYARQL